MHASSHSWMVWWKQVLQDPSSMATLVPSSRFLASAMASAANINEQSFVIELGPGLGHITSGLLAAGARGDHVVALELQPSLAKMMSIRHPSVRTFAVDARYMNFLQRDLSLPPAHAVVSSLGLRNMDNATVEHILRAARAALRDDGVFVQYTYGRRDPVATNVLERTGWRSEKVETVLRNTPPATIFRYTKT